MTRPLSRPPDAAIAWLGALKPQPPARPSLPLSPPRAAQRHMPLHTFLPAAQQPALLLQPMQRARRQQNSQRHADHAGIRKWMRLAPLPHRSRHWQQAGTPMQLADRQQLPSSPQPSQPSIRCWESFFSARRTGFFGILFLGAQEVVCAVAIEPHRPCPAHARAPSTF